MEKQSDEKNNVKPAQTITPLQNMPVTLTTQLSELHNAQSKAKLLGLGVLAPIYPVLSCPESYVKPDRTLSQATGVELARWRTRARLLAGCFSPNVGTILRKPCLSWSGLEEKAAEQKLWCTNWYGASGSGFSSLNKKVGVAGLDTVEIERRKVLPKQRD